MKRFLFICLTIFFAVLYSLLVFGQNPPLPNGGDGIAGGHSPVGGGAPIDGGTIILGALAIGYVARKIYRNRNQIME